MSSYQVKELSPTGKILHWFSEYKKASGQREGDLKRISEESGIPISSLYKAVRELEKPLTRSGSTMEF